MLSERLKMVADMVDKCRFVADIGTDHAYLPIYLIKNGIAERAVAADISSGSCKKALDNIRRSGLEDYIEVRCGNGLEVMTEDEIPDTIVISGMGGMLAIDVLKSHKCGSLAPCLVLQVQRDICAVRKHIISSGYKIKAEDMLREDGKLYTAISAVKGRDTEYTELEYMFGRYLLKSKAPLLREYIEYEHKKILNVLSRLEKMDGEDIKKRRTELERLSVLQKEALECL